MDDRSEAAETAGLVSDALERLAGVAAALRAADVWAEPVPVDYAVKVAAAQRRWDAFYANPGNGYC